MFLDDSGFSLVELAIALALVTAVVVGVAGAVRGSLEAVTSSARVSEATSLLMQQWAELERQGVAEGQDRGELGDGWEWEYSASPLIGNDGFVEVRLRVVKRFGERTQEAALTSLAPAPVEGLGSWVPGYM